MGEITPDKKLTKSNSEERIIYIPVNNYRHVNKLSHVQIRRKCIRITQRVSMLLDINVLVKYD